MMNSIVYLKAFAILLGVGTSIILVTLLVKKTRFHEHFSSAKQSKIKILEIKKIDHNKSVVVICQDDLEYTCVLAENYGFLLEQKDGGESRIRTYERTRRADLQSAAFGHSAISPENKAQGSMAYFDIKSKSSDSNE